MLSTIKSQFGHPTGALGKLVGWTMAVNNRERVEWAIETLNVQPDDRILEIGSGPGVSIQLMAEKLTTGCIQGFDISAEMLAQAAKRNAAAIRAGQVELRQGSMPDLPYPDDSFDKVLAINSLHHCPHPAAPSLANIRQVLKPGGTINIVEQPRWAQTETQVQQAVDRLVNLIHEAGFQRIEVWTQPMKPVTALFVTGSK